MPKGFEYGRFKNLTFFSKGLKYRGDRLRIRRIKSDKESDTQSEPFYDLYWKKIDNNIHCVFKMDIVNIERGWARTFKIYLVVTEGTSSNEEFDKRQGTFNIIIKTISLEEFSYLLLDGVSSSEYDSYYRIKNTLHLMDPYLTSGKEMQITDSMRKNFNNVLKKLT